MSDDELPEREEFAHDPIGHTRVTAGMSVGDLATEYGNAGIGAADLADAVGITAEMFGDEETSVFFGLAGAMVPCGMRQVVIDLIREGYIDALVTTGANLTHDTIEAIGGKHHHGRAGPRDRRPGASRSGSSEDSGEHGTDRHDEKTPREHDEALREEWVDRIYNVYLPQEHFTEMETHVREEVFSGLERTVSIQELTAELGKANAAANEREGVKEDPGVAAAAYECDVPIYCPAIQDSVLGLQAWIYSQTTDFSLDALADMTHLNDLAYHAERTGAFVVGGGVPKNYTLQTMLVTPTAYDYAVQLTMDSPRTGGLSGATLDEARSWGKIETAGENASVYADATITLPLVVAAACERIDRS
ncbi:deoxyhypusine synthase [Natronorarus salvus]|uniref:deoxyhypusine synthase n=1 Tax=Natronorarus salvus TaxID=3117733 RepID=UPI002F2642BF